LISLAFAFDCAADLVSRGACGKHKCLFDAFALPAGPGPDSLASSTGPPEMPSIQNASAAFPESARAYPAAGHAPGRRSTRDRATNICWRLLVRTMPGQNCIDPRALEDRPRRFRVGILRAPKTWTLKKLGCGVNFPSGGIARICVGRHSGIDADSDTWHQRAGADVPHG
jgi:hypothetical protein